MIRIIVDSASDFQQAELKEKGMELVSLSITLCDRTYLDGVDLDRDEFYETLQNTGEFPMTSQPSPQAFLDIFKDAKSKGDEVICILLSSGLSGTCQSATIAKGMADYENIYIVDSLTATYMIKILADYAYDLSMQGVSAKEIVEKIENLKSKVKVVAALDTLEYLSRGGRISKTAAAIGNMANLKPLITVTEEGLVSMIGKALGKAKASGTLLKHLQGYKINTDFPVYSVYTYGTENCEAFEQKLAAEGYRITSRQQVGPTIGAHIGPGIFGVIFVAE
ncbi:MAG: DegV family protein [Lachnospiraceae bacterium]|nr:DegV family protein [Lachnospiraceae bacterium]